jgi:hypothetical protein
VQQHDGIALSHLHVRHLAAEDPLPLLLIWKCRRDHDRFSHSTIGHSDTASGISLARDRCGLANLCLTREAPSARVSHKARGADICGFRASELPCAQKPNSSNNSMPVCAYGQYPNFLFAKIVNYAIPNRPDSARGADRDRHEREAGCDGRGLYRRTYDTIADGGGVWSWHPWAGAKPVDDDRQVTVTMRSRTPGRARTTPLTPSRRENRIVSVYLW